MAGHIDRHGQARHMGGHLLDGEAEAGGPAAEALRSDAQLIDGRQKLFLEVSVIGVGVRDCLLYTSPSPRDRQKSRMPSSA